MLRALFFLAIFCWAKLLGALPEGLLYQVVEKTGPLTIHLLEVDPTKIKIQAVHAGEEILALETVSSMAKRYRAAAAINGGFFRAQGAYRGTSAGILRIGGKWYSSPRLNRGAIGWSQSDDLQFTQTAIDRVALDMELFLNGARFAIDGINQPPTLNSAILYTSQFHRMTLTSSAFSELTLSPDGTCHVQQGPSPIPSDGYVYSLAPLASIAMPFGLPTVCGLPQIAIRTLNHPHDAGIWASFPNIVGGAPVLVSDGEIVHNYSIEQLPDSFAKERHPRTAIGINRKGIWTVAVVEGDNRENSIGMTIDELAQFMHELGCLYALNLDGGSSSTLVIEGNLVNSPSGALSKNPEDLHGIEKPVSDAILFLEKSS